MKRIVCIIVLIDLVLSVPEQKWRESDDGSKFYIETTKKVNWFEAWSDCVRLNMSLIAIDTLEKHQQIDNLLKRMYVTCPVVWIGGHDNAVTLRYEWASTGEPFTFTNWGPKQPANSGTEHCLEFWNDFQWHDYPCNGSLGYICEEHPFVKSTYRKRSSLNVQDLSDLKNVLVFFKNGARKGRA